MKFWNFISGFLAFNWLLDMMRKLIKKNDPLTGGAKSLRDEINGDFRGGFNGEIDSCEDAIIDHNTDTEELDDLDIFMRDNPEGDTFTRRSGWYDDIYHRDGRYHNYDDFGAGSYGQSFDSFHEEQDDYDMMDDF